MNDPIKQSHTENDHERAHTELQHIVLSFVELFHSEKLLPESVQSALTRQQQTLPSCEERPVHQTILGLWTFELQYTPSTQYHRNTQTLSPIWI